MSREDAIDAVLKFLDQFVERGASADILDVRRRLASSPHTQAAFFGFCRGNTLSNLDAFVAMRNFFEAELGSLPEPSRTDQADLIDLLSWTTIESDVGGTPQTADPAQWFDWIASVAKV